MKSKKILLCIIIVFLFGMILGPQSGKDSQANEVETEKKVVILVANALTWQDIDDADTPFIDSLVARYASANMSSRTVGPKTAFVDACSTLGSGNRIKNISSRSILAYKSEVEYGDGTVADEYQRRTGKIAPEESIINLDIEKQIKENNAIDFGSIPGFLGQYLHENGLSTCVIGNSDYSVDGRPEKIHREAASVVMDESGVVDYGIVDSTVLRINEDVPFGIETDTDVVLEAFEKFYSKSDVIVVDFGDTARNDASREFTNRETWLSQKNKAVSRLDDFTSDLISLVDLDETLFILVSPNSSMNTNEPQQLTTFVMASSDIKSGLLQSATTHQPGVVVNVDFAPTVLSHFEIGVPVNMNGRPIFSTSYKGARIDHLIGFNNRAVYMGENQSQAMVVYVFFMIIVCSVALFVFLRKMNRLYRQMAIYLVLFAMTIPLSFYLASLVIGVRLPSNLFFPVALLVAAAITTVAFFLRRFDKLVPMIFICGLTLAWLLIDLLTGSRAIINTVLFGYSPIIAGRFYGIGNEAMSIFLISSLLFIAFIYEDFTAVINDKKWILISICVFLVFMIGFPRFGADIGGTITTAIAYFVTLWWLFNKKIRVTKIIAALLILTMLLGVFVVADLYRSEENRTHIGQTALRIKDDGFNALSQILKRKVGTNFRIMRTSLWSLLVFVIIGLLVFLSFYPQSSLKMLETDYPSIMLGLKGAYVGAILGFLTNDSGVVIPALMLVFVVSTIFYLLLTDITPSANKTLGTT